MPRLVIHWARFGPYHLARLREAQRKFQKVGVQVVGIETANQDETYGWENVPDNHGIKKRTLFPRSSYETLPRLEMVRRMWRELRGSRPIAVAVSGYATPDALTLLGWSQVHSVPRILMTESKRNDATRRWYREMPKKVIVTRFSAALCGGQLHRAYLRDLGFPSDRIFLGYDVVDNEYFRRTTESLRRESDSVSSAHAIERPYFLASARFVKRKNIDGLIKAYHRYTEQLAASHPALAPWDLVVLGDGEEKANLQALVARLHLTGVRFPGFLQIDELPFYYAHAGLFIHPALQEQWGLVVNEAMASGLPVAVSRTCGCAPDLIEDGQNGLLFDPEDLDGLANILLGATVGDYDLEGFGERALVKIAEYDVDRFAEGLLSAAAAASESLRQMISRMPDIKADWLETRLTDRSL